MKHFEDLWEENGGGIFGKQACEKYYRLALEWALEQEEWQGTDEDGRWGVSKGDIREELES